MQLQSYLQDRLKQKGYLFAPYLALGDPDFDTSLKLIDSMIEAGADTIELGLPFTDPTADGPLLQRTFSKVLSRGFSLDKVFSLLEKVKEKHPEQPLLLMGYGNLFLQAGFKPILKKLAEYNIRGLITPDIPFEEKQKLIKKFSLQPELKTISWVDFVTPTIDDKRLDKVCKNARGFIYVVSYKGITGQSGFDLAPIKKVFAKIRKRTDVPMLVGFGIREASHSAQAVKYADGFIVGTRIHQLIDEYENKSDQVAAALKNELLALQP